MRVFMKTYLIFSSMLGLILASGQVVMYIQPLQTVDLRAVLSSRTGLKDFEIRDVAQSKDGWAILATSKSSSETLVAKGGIGVDVTVSQVLLPGPNRLALDEDGLLYISSETRSRPGITDVEVRDGSLQQIGTYAVPANSLEPIRAGRRILWTSRAGLFDVSGIGITTPDSTGYWKRAPRSVMRSTSPPQRHMIFALPAERWLEFFDHDEDVSVFDKDGSLIAQKKLDLSRAYRAAMLEVPNYEASSAYTRTSWAAVSTSGLLYICLSGTRSAEPAYLAVFEPLTGELIKILVAQLPTNVGRIDQYNPKGLIHPHLGVIADRIAIVDAGVAVLSLYPLN
jgi:hypothetical protein